MKNIVIMLGLVASFIMFTGCASKSEPTVAPAITETAPVHHHNFKGEVGK